MPESPHPVDPGSARSGGADSGTRSVQDVLSDAARSSVPPVDMRSVLARSRRRRLPGQLAAGGVGVLAIAGIGFAGVSLAQSVTPTAVLSNGDASTGETADRGDSTGADSPAGTDAGSPSGTNGAAGGSLPGEAISLAPPEKINPCGGTLAELAPAASGLVATPVFPDRIPSGTEPVPGSVTVTNTGTERVTGYTGARPAITVSADGITVWHSNGPHIMLAQEIDLEPGASMDLPASITPVRCTEEDESGESFREDLPALHPGTYQLTAIFYLIRDADAAAGSAPDVVSGPATPITVE
ncbi:hypothetical protein [Planctomonas psychrotolerans]|uniref:hypothetical protein n=1 Tax=Planctomonas psychrotolerans TaxID=2528712 RepID=UPI0012387AB7|nr:hypothetical protein [Planctomonas psychrotolerans]